MTEHDAPTVARATLWLDTSNETSTRRAECFEDCETLAFERPALEPATADVPCAPPALIAQPAVTMALDREHAFAAFEASATSTFAAMSQPAASYQAAGPRALWRSVASHVIALSVGAVSMACVLSLRPSEPAPRAAAMAPHASPVSIQRVTKAQPPATPPPSAAALQNGAVDVTLSGAVEALARGDYATAHASYAALAAQRPHDAALVAVAGILTDRIAARCASDGRKGVPCER